MNTFCESWSTLQPRFKSQGHRVASPSTPFSKNYIKKKDIFLRIIDPSRNRLASTAYFAIVSSVFCMHGYAYIKINFFTINYNYVLHESGNVIVVANENICTTIALQINNRINLQWIHNLQGNKTIFQIHACISKTFRLYIHQHEFRS